ncbi:hypothetical protein SARC_10240 [Sphaeroforma arctica JP610]|uniref:Uncharacterized protein n=1 Tax=Sphaeroforma arctica JP610 TaxID=667725 RepID=A0A0L0FLD0_9EUKA|nr:hypothetical protein SARC_10240 [Sphaeroforma arctica JP610]KNC77296.1 hypothetical protein SARC_10240 [Sphaeroforma arctica JP610]|eukprot:XP_014151198.1 hypothetical protein SARC_10240 [Sphaeroforma arctica JP610]
MALSILSIYSRVAALANSAPMLEALPLLLGLLPHSDEDLDDVDANMAGRMQDDTLECILGVVTTSAGASLLVQQYGSPLLRSIMVLAAQDITTPCVADILDRLCACEINLFTSVPASERVYIRDSFVPKLAEQFHTRQDAYKFRLCRILERMLSAFTDCHVLIGDGDVAQSVTVRHIRCGLRSLLTNKLDAANRKHALGLAAVMMRWSGGVQWIFTDPNDEVSVPVQTGDKGQDKESVGRAGVTSAAGVVLPRAKVQLSEAYSANTPHLDSGERKIFLLTLATHLACAEARLALDAFGEADVKLYDHVRAKDVKSKIYHTLLEQQNTRLALLSVCFELLETSIVTMVTNHPDDSGFDWLLVFAAKARGPITECVESVLQFLSDVYEHLQNRLKTYTDSSSSVKAKRATSSGQDGEVLRLRPSRLQPRVEKVCAAEDERVGDANSAVHDAGDNGTAVNDLTHITDRTSKVIDMGAGEPVCPVITKDACQETGTEESVPVDGVGIPASDGYTEALQLACVRVVGAYFAEETDDLQTKLQSTMPALMSLCRHGGSTGPATTRSTEQHSATDAKQDQSASSRTGVGSQARTRTGADTVADGASAMRAPDGSVDGGEWVALGMLLPMLLNVSCDTDGGGQRAFIAAEGLEVVGKGLLRVLQARKTCVDYQGSSHEGADGVQSGTTAQTVGRDIVRGHTRIGDGADTTHSPAETTNTTKERTTTTEERTSTTTSATKETTNTTDETIQTKGAARAASSHSLEHVSADGCGNGVLRGFGDIASLSFLENSVNVMLNVAVLDGAVQCFRPVYTDLARGLIESPPEELFLRVCSCALLAFIVQHTVSERNRGISATPGFQAGVVDMLQFVSATCETLLRDCISNAQPAPSQRSQTGTTVEPKDVELPLGNVGKVLVPAGYDYEGIREPWFLCMQALAGCVRVLPSAQVTAAVLETGALHTITSAVGRRSERQLKAVPDLVMACTGLAEAVATHCPAAAAAAAAAASL